MAVIILSIFLWRQPEHLSQIMYVFTPTGLLFLYDCDTPGLHTYHMISPSYYRRVQDVQTELHAFVMTLPPVVLPPEIIIMSDIAGARIESAWDTQELLHSLFYAEGNAAATFRLSVTP